MWAEVHTGDSMSFLTLKDLSFLLRVEVLFYQSLHDVHTPTVRTVHLLHLLAGGWKRGTLPPFDSTVQQLLCFGYTGLQWSLGKSRPQVGPRVHTANFCRSLRIRGVSSAYFRRLTALAGDVGVHGENNLWQHAAPEKSLEPFGLTQHSLGWHNVTGHKKAP